VFVGSGHFLLLTRVIGGIMLVGVLGCVKMLEVNNIGNMCWNGCVSHMPFVMSSSNSDCLK